MTRERLAQGSLVAVMLIVASIAWWMELRPVLAVDASALGVLPSRIGAWRGSPVPIEDFAERMLQADYNLQRAYRSPTGSPTGSKVVWLYVGYYGTHRGGRPEHTPDQCYPSSGWGIVSQEVVEIDPELRANEFVVARDGDRRLVHFWYQSSRRAGMLGAWDVSVDHLRGRLEDGRADGALVRISTPIDADDLETPRTRLRAFARELLPLLRAHWPREFPAE
jgi:EpsI family protein